MYRIILNLCGTNIILIYKDLSTIKVKKTADKNVGSFEAVDKVFFDKLRETPGEGFPLALRAIHLGSLFTNFRLLCNTSCAFESKKEFRSCGSDKRRCLLTPKTF